MKFDHFGVWHEQPIVVVDVETTGYSPGHGDKVVEIAAVRMERLKITKTWQSFLNPGRLIPEQASLVHGLYDEDVALAPTFGKVAPEFLSFCDGAFPAAYKHGFDFGFIMAELWESGFGNVELTSWPGWLDPLPWVRFIDRFVPAEENHKLTSACARRGIEVHGAHGALADATATALLIGSLAGDMPGCTASELLRRQGLISLSRARRNDAARKAGRLS